MKIKIIIVAEAWGRSEAQMQHPLVGASGRELSLELGISKLAPFMLVNCRKCKAPTRFIENFCETCHEHIWPNEFDLIEHWKTLKSSGLIHVTNVFNAKPPDTCLNCFSINTAPRGRGFVCRDCGSKNIRTNDIGYFFNKEDQTGLPPCRIPKNYSGTHLKSEHFHHVKRLWREIEDLKPNLVLALGNVSAWALLGQTKIMSIRGTVNWSDRLGVKVLPTIHPAGVMRQWAVRPAVLADLEKATREAEFPEIRRPFRWITIPAPNESGLNEIRQWLDNSGLHPLTNDIETIRKQISIIGFGHGPESALVIPFRDCNSENGKIVDVGKIAASIGFEGGINFWPTEELEFQAWKLAIKTIESRQISLCFQNGLYDMSYYLKMGIHPYRADDDTMLWHHSQYPEQPKALGYLGSIYSNDIAWKNMRRSTDSLKRDE